MPEVPARNAYAPKIAGIHEQREGGLLTQMACKRVPMNGTLTYGRSDEMRMIIESSSGPRNVSISYYSWM